MNTEKNTERRDLWNPMIKLLRKIRNPDVVRKGNLLLDQYNTAGGRELVGREMENFLRENGY
jgi:hypothetical protein